MFNKLLIPALVLAGSVAAAYAIRRRSRDSEALQHKEDLQTWEGEGGKPASSAARSSRADPAPVRLN